MTPPASRRLAGGQRPRRGEAARDLGCRTPRKLRHDPPRDRPGATSSILRIGLGAGVAVAVVVLGVMHRSTVDAGGDSLAGADGEWLVPAVLVTVAMWIANSVSLFGSMPVRPPIRRVLAVQIAASFANHVLPAGSGGVAVNVRFLQRYGLSRGVAVGVVGLNSLATGVTHIALLAGCFAFAPSTLTQIRHRGPRLGRVPLAGALLSGGRGAVLVTVLVAALIVLVASVGRFRRWLARHVGALREMKELVAVLRHPGRAAALWLGSLALPVCHAVILLSILRGLRVNVGLGTVMVIYLGVSSLAAFVPAPGGIGGLDVALAAGLAATGVTAAVAVGAMLGYRMITVWLPMVPAACMFVVLLRRRII